MKRRQKPESSQRVSSPIRFGIPWDVAGRIGLLFTVLCLIKLTMLVGLRKHLFEIHWRTQSLNENWLNLVAFSLFTILIGLNLWRLGKRCSPAGLPAVRMANLCVLVLAVFFIFLTFNVGDKNYLYPLLDQTLKWPDLRAYLILNFFFQAPFLAAWLAVYALIYYYLARTKREHLILRVTAIFAVIYLAVFLNQLMSYCTALWVADCLGLVCLLTTSSQRAVNWFYLLQPWFWPLFFFLIFRGQSAELKNLEPECAILSSGCVLLFVGGSLLAWRRHFLSAWMGILPFAFMSFLLLTNINYPTATAFQNFVCVGLTLPHYFLGEFLVALILLGLAKFYKHWLPNGSLWWLDGISVCIIIIALVDLRLSQLMGVRLDWQVIEFGASAKMIWREAKPFLPALIIGLIVILALYAILIGLWQRGPVAKSMQPGVSGKFLLLLFLALGLAGNWLMSDDKAKSESALLLIKTSPWFQSSSHPIMDRKTFMTAARELGMESMLQPIASSPARVQRKLNVLLIFQESSYNKYLSLFDGQVETQPLLAAYKDRMELFPDFFSNFAGSINARFATFTGLYPVCDYKTFTLNHVNVKSLFDILHDHDYECSLFYSSFLDYTGFRDFLQGRGLAKLYDADTMPGRTDESPVAWGLREDQTVRAIRAQISEYATNHQTFFLAYVPAAPHNPFDGVPDQFRKYQLQQAGDYTPSYLNELLYLDACITSILDQLKTSGLLDNTLVVITDDHGEMLGANGGPIGHGWAVTPDLVNIPLIIMDPASPGYRLNDTVGSQVDLLPTILDLLGLPLPADQLYQGASLYSSNAKTPRTIYLNSFQQYGVLEDHSLVCGDRVNQGAPSTNGFSFTAYAITNQNARTFFPKIPFADAPVPSISDFDKFQENFLLNYVQYCQMMRK